MDVRCKSPFDVSAALDILRRLSITDDALWDERDWSGKHEDHSMPTSFEFEEEDADACDPCLYDPALFATTACHPGSPLLISCPVTGDREKPLPPPPETITPTTPRLSHTPTTPASTPSSSPRGSLSAYSQPSPRSRTPSTSTPRGNAHAAFPSISSTLSSLSERESEAAKRSGVFVPQAQDMDASSSETAVLVRPPPRRSSSDALQVLSAAEGSPKRRPRPKLTLASSTSTPQLRELAELANTPASPILSHQPSLASLATSFASGAPSTVNLLPPFSLEAPSSRWSMDSTDHHAIIRPVITSPIAESPQASPAKTKTRDRLMSFISRARAGSVDKQSTSPTRGDHSPRSPRDYDFGLPPQSGLSSTMSSRRTSRSTYAPQPISTATSTTSSQSDTSIVTPGDSQQDVTSPDPFRSASTSFTPVSFMPDLTDTPDTPAANELDFFPLEPTLPPPSPDVPTPSLFLPAKPESLLSSLARKAIRRRKKKLVISVMPSPYDDDSDGEAGRMRRAREQKQRDDHILRWCDNLGTVRHFECLDGDFHVYWRDSEVAEMVSRVGSQVIIRGVGRVSLSWRYVN